MQHVMLDVQSQNMNSLYMLCRMHAYCTGGFRRDTALATQRAVSSERLRNKAPWCSVIVWPVSKFQSGEIGSAPERFELSKGMFRSILAMVLGFETLNLKLCESKLRELAVKRKRKH